MSFSCFPFSCVAVADPARSQGRLVAGLYVLGFFLTSSLGGLFIHRTFWLSCRCGFRVCHVLFPGKQFL